jgi:hypothetical protein
MPKSRLRGGSKAHRKRVQKRKDDAKTKQNQIQKIWEQEMMKRMEELNAMSANTSDEIEIQDENKPLDIKL